MPEHELSRHVLCLDSSGLILSDRAALEPHKREIAADPGLVADWSDARDRRYRLADVVRCFKPTVLIGVSGQPAAFTEEIVTTMHRGCERPIILPLSNPTSRIEARPEDLLRWTWGAAVIGTGSPFPPVEYGGMFHHVGQGNNALIFPGVGLGAVAVGARGLPDEAFAAAADALYEYTVPSIRLGAPIYPPLRRLREVSRLVAVAVGRALVEGGAAPEMTRREIEDRVTAMMWEPVYQPYRLAEA